MLSKATWGLVGPRGKRMGRDSAASYNFLIFSASYIASPFFFLTSAGSDLLTSALCDSFFSVGFLVDS